jgi:hypothetical protein
MANFFNGPVTRSTVLDEIIKELEAAREAATMERFGCAFPHERIVIKSAHFPGAGEEPGTEHHPTDYVKDKVKLHHDTWVIRPIDTALALVRANAELLERCTELSNALQQQNLGRINELARAGMER